MALFLTTFGLVMLIGVVFVFVLNDNRLAPRHLLTVFVVAFFLAWIPQEGKYPSDTQSAGGLLCAVVFGLATGFGLESRHKKRNDTSRHEDS